MSRNPQPSSPLSPLALAGLMVLGVALGSGATLLVRGRQAPPEPPPQSAIPPAVAAAPVLTEPSALAPVAPVQPLPTPVPPPTPSLLDHVRRFDTAQAMADIRYLSESIGPRYGGTAEEVQTATYLSQQLPLAYDVDFQDGIPMPAVGRQTLNVVARHPDFSPQRPRIILGAHMDSIDAGGGSPGANDNGTGVAVVLEVARRLADVSLPYALEIVFYGCEEAPRPGLSGHFGSRWHADQSRAAPLVGVLNVDMIGVGETLYAVSYDDPPAMAARDNFMKDLAVDSARRLGVPLDPNRNNRFSDHEPYARQGIPHVWLFRRLDPRYHTWQDQAQFVAPQHVEAAGRLTLHMLLSLGGPEWAL